MSCNLEKPTSMVNELRVAIESGDLEEIDKLIYSGININADMGQSHTPLKLAKNLKKFNVAGLISRRGGTLDCTVEKKINLSGVSKLSVACRLGDMETVKSLLSTHEKYLMIRRIEYPDLPINIAVLNGHTEIVTLLLDAGANINARFNRIVYSNFGVNSYPYQLDYDCDGRNLVTHAIISSNSNLANLLINRGADLKLNDNQKKRTLLMFAVQNNLLDTVTTLLTKLDKTEINSRDIYGYTAGHYLFKYGNRYSSEFVELDEVKGSILLKLINAGLDIYLSPPMSPDNHLIHLAAFRSSLSALKILLPRHRNSSDSLYYLLKKTFIFDKNEFLKEKKFMFDYPDDYYRLSESTIKKIQTQKYNCLQEIFVDIIRRLYVGEPVSQTNELIFKKITKECFHFYYLSEKLSEYVEASFAQLKNKVASFEDINISLQEILVTKESKLINLIKNPTFFEAFKLFKINNENKNWYLMAIRRVYSILTRIELLQKLRRIVLEKNFWYLDYKIIEKIVGFMSNQDLERFINICDGGIGHEYLSINCCRCHK